MCQDAFSGNALYVAEKLASFCAFTAVVLCLVTTLMITLAVGIGTGYNYCFVDTKVKREVAGAPDLKDSFMRRSQDSQAEPDSYEPRRRLVSDDVPTTTATSSATTERTTESPVPPVSVNKYTLTIPLHANIDFLALIAKLRARNKNVTLELVT